MVLKSPCEFISAKILPGVRAAIVEELVFRYSMKQTDVANLLGVTQACVSHYLTAARAKDSDLYEKFPEIKSYASTVAEKLIEKNTYDITLCSICKEIRENPNFIRLQEKVLGNKSSMR